MRLAAENLREGTRVCRFWKLYACEGSRFQSIAQIGRLVWQGANGEQLAYRETRRLRALSPSEQCRFILETRIAAGHATPELLNAGLTYQQFKAGAADEAAQLAREISKRPFRIVKFKAERKRK